MTLITIIAVSYLDNSISKPPSTEHSSSTFVIRIICNMTKAWAETSANCFLAEWRFSIVNPATMNKIKPENISITSDNVKGRRRKPK